MGSPFIRSTPGSLETQVPGITPFQMPQNPGLPGGGGADFEALLRYKMARQAAQDRDAREMRQIAMIQQGKDADFQDQMRARQLQQQPTPGQLAMEQDLKNRQLVAETALKEAASRPMPRSVQGLGPQQTAGYMTDYSQVPQALLPKESTMHHGEADTVASIGGYGSPSPDVNALPYGLGVGKDPRSPNFGAQTIDTGEGAGGGAGPSPQEAARRAGIGLVPQIVSKKPGE